MFIKPFIELDRLLLNQLSSSLFYKRMSKLSVNQNSLTNANRAYIIYTYLKYFSVYYFFIISNENLIHNKQNLDLKFKSNF